MPLYEYRCKACGHQFEKIQSFSAPEEKVCPVCGGEVERLLSAPAVQFKGSGWYVTDYAGKSASKAVSGSSDGNAGKADSKPAASTESSASKSESAPAPSSSSTKSE